MALDLRESSQNYNQGVVKCRRKAFIEANRKLRKKQTDAAQHNRDVNRAYKCDTDRLWSERTQEVVKASAEGNTQQQYALIRHHTRSRAAGPPIPEEKWKEQYSIIMIAWRLYSTS